MIIAENPTAVTSDYVTALIVEGRSNKLVKAPNWDARALTVLIELHLDELQ
jgi:hypothetical protein